MKNSEQKYLSIAKKYAQAIIKTAQDRNFVDKAYNDLKLLQEVYYSSADLQQVSSSPAIEKEDKKSIFSEILKDKISYEVLNLVYCLIDNNRLDIINALVESYHDLMDEIQNISRVEVVSAVEIDETRKQKLQQKLEEKLKNTVFVDYSLDKNIMAGLIVKIGEKTIDLSLLAKLENMKKQIM